MVGENIICFAKDWSEDPTSNNHVMRLLARRNKVLWLNSIAMRTPRLSDSNDLRKIGRKLRTLTQANQSVAPNLDVYTPIVLPFPHSRMAASINRRLLRTATSRLRRRLGMDRFQLWTFLPNAVEYVGQLGESLVVYYCIDEFSQFSYLDGRKMAAMEEDLCRRADIVFATSNALLEGKKAFNPETHLASHGVDYGHFSQSMDPATPLAPELRDIPGPILGFFGLIHDWIDLDLIAYLAEKRPDWSIVMIGKAAVDTSMLDRYRNVYLLGRRPYETLPQYCRGFSLGLIPFRVNELTRNVNPIKLREYISAGLPVVSTALPEVMYCKAWCDVADDYAEFVAACDRALSTDSPVARRQRSEAMSTEDWEHKVELIGRHVDRVQAAKHG